jgi:tight adherence protein B
VSPLGLPLAFAAGALASVAAADLLSVGAQLARTRAPQGLAVVAGLVDAAIRVGREGRRPGTVERRRMLALGASAALAAGTLTVGPLIGLLLATVGPWTVARLLRARREHYRRAVDAGAAEAALALADALTAGHSLRGALAAAAGALGGQVGHELRRTAAELAAGASTGQALDDLRARSRSARIGTIVAACLVQRRAGGDLARLLRECAGSFGEQARLEDEVRAATAQARFTGVVVVLMPLGGGMLAELASPGFAEALLGSWLTAWLVGLAVAMQAGAAVAIRRLGKVRW